MSCEQAQATSRAEFSVRTASTVCDRLLPSVCTNIGHSQNELLRYQTQVGGQETNVIHLALEVVAFCFLAYVGFLVSRLSGSAAFPFLLCGTLSEKHRQKMTALLSGAVSVEIRAAIVVVGVRWAVLEGTAKITAFIGIQTYATCFSVNDGAGNDGVGFCTRTFSVYHIGG